MKKLLLSVLLGSLMLCAPVCFGQQGHQKQPVHTKRVYVAHSKKEQQEEGHAVAKQPRIIKKYYYHHRPRLVRRPSATYSYGPPAQRIYYTPPAPMMGIQLVIR